MEKVVSCNRCGKVTGVSELRADIKGKWICTSCYERIFRNPKRKEWNLKKEQVHKEKKHYVCMTCSFKTWQPREDVLCPNCGKSGTLRVL